MIAINRFVIRVRDARKPRVAGIIEKQCHRLRERRVIVLERQDIVRPLLRNGLGDLFLTPHRVNRDHRPFGVQQLEEPGNRCNFIRLLLDLHHSASYDE